MFRWDLLVISNDNSDLHIVDVLWYIIICYEYANDAISGEMWHNQIFDNVSMGRNINAFIFSSFRL